MLIMGRCSCFVVGVEAGSLSACKAGRMCSAPDAALAKTCILRYAG
jgi:hypothetical protein